jgi:hypothetical protein
VVTANLGNLGPEFQVMIFRVMAFALPASRAFECDAGRSVTPIGGQRPLRE